MPAAMQVNVCVCGAAPSQFANAPRSCRFPVFSPPPSTSTHATTPAPTDARPTNLEEASGGALDPPRTKHDRPRKGLNAGDSAPVHGSLAARDAFHRRARAQQVLHLNPALLRQILHALRHNQRLAKAAAVDAVGAGLDQHAGVRAAGGRCLSRWCPIVVVVAGSAIVVALVHLDTGPAAGRQHQVHGGSAGDEPRLCVPGPARACQLLHGKSSLETDACPRTGGYMPELSERGNRTQRRYRGALPAYSAPLSSYSRCQCGCTPATDWMRSYCVRAFMCEGSRRSDGARARFRHPHLLQWRLMQHRTLCAAVARALDCVASASGPTHKP